jgi:MFS family permease
VVSTEKTPLIGNAHVSITSTPSASPPLSSLWQNIPVVASLIIYIVLKLVLECLITASSTIAQWYFHWDSTKNGFYLAALGLLMFPTNFLVGQMSYRYEDRELIVLSEVMMLIGVAGIISYGDYTVFQFILGGVIIFISTNVLEGVNMALLSKTIPKSFAKGTFNSGLLATEAGTLGRALGDIFITVVGLPGIQYVLNWTFVPLLMICLLTILYTLRSYRHLTTND